jgi:hypothetical protein
MGFRTFILGRYGSLGAGEGVLEAAAPIKAGVTFNV